jgi:membrane fusion protein (multidrug efflux system)
MLRKPLVRLSLLVLALVLAGAGAAYYWRYTSIYVSTDDAYVSGHMGMISARVPGRVDKVLVDNNEAVQPGQALLTLERQDFEVAVAQAEANVNRLRQDLAQGYVKVSTAKARIAEAEAHLRQASIDQKRYASLYARQTVPRQTLDRVETQLKVARAEVDQAKQQQREALAAIGGATSIPLEEQPALKQARAQLEQARLNLSYVKITAPFSGYITKRQVKAGNWVQPGQPLMMLVPLDYPELWIDANFKETQLTNVHLGQPAEVTVDTYPGVTFKGKVDSITSGTGAAFSLLPPENATGNWVKVVQRIPVKIKLLPPFPENQPLRLGMSSTVTIDTHDRSGPRLLSAGRGR